MAVIVMGLEGTVSICCFLHCPLKAFQAIHLKRYKSYNMTLGYPWTSWLLVLNLTMVSTSSFCIYSLILTFMILFTNAGRLEPSNVFCLLAISYNMQPRAQMSLL